MNTLYTIMNMVGYITAPLLFYFLVEGLHRTSDLKRYAARMAVFAAISYVPYIHAMQGGWPGGQNYMSLNVLFTMLAGLGLMYVRRCVLKVIPRWALILLLFALTVTSDWSPQGPDLRTDL